MENRSLPAARSYRGRMRGEYSPNGRCFADVTTKMLLTIPLDSPRSPFSISPQ